MSTVRLRRLTADHARLKEYVRLHPRIRLLQAEGDPPERYQLEYRINSVRMVNGELEPVKTHVVEIVLPLNYPRTPPHCRMLSPVFHPNIAPHAICVGDHWSSGEPLSSIVTRIGELLAYQAYNVKSPLNGEAARWAEENQHRLPLDAVSLLTEEESAAAVPAARVAPAPSPALPMNGSQPIEAPTHSPELSFSVPEPPAPAVVSAPLKKAASFTCPSCQKSYRLRDDMVGRKLRCIACHHVFTLPAP